MDATTVFEFDIFTGTSNTDARWVEAAPGLAAARERMEAIAYTLPGQYFVFSQRTHAILARIDTRKSTPPPHTHIHRSGKIA